MTTEIMTMTTLCDSPQFPSSFVSEYYTGKSVFITGGTGFVGKALMEKLLRSCDGIDSIYVLLRAKRGVPMKERLQQLLNNPIFDGIRKSKAEVLNKVHGIQGDITIPKFGISDKDLELLFSKVNIVFHSAATVKFDEPLKLAVNINILGTRRIIELCQKMRNLESLVHVSTAYAHCTRFQIDETFYPTLVNTQKFIETVDWMDAKLLDRITLNIIDKWPNTYTFTKAIAENLILQESGSLPVAIIRPSIVNSAWREPVPGWVDNMNGPTGMIVVGSKGILRNMVCHDKPIDLVPVDIVVNLMIVVAWNTATHRPNDIRIFHAVADPKTRITWKQWVRLIHSTVLRYPSERVFRYPGGDCTASYFWYSVYGVIFQHLIPGFFADIALYISGKKPRLLKVYRKLHYAIECLQYFTVHHWEFDKTNVYALQNILSVKDKQTFSFDMSELHMPTYLEENVLGIRHFIMKEDPASLPEARRRLRRLYLGTQVTKGLFISAAFWLLSSQVQIIGEMWHFATSNLYRHLIGNWF